MKNTFVIPSVVEESFTTNFKNQDIIDLLILLQKISPRATLGRDDNL
jgi:hypothetical protein